MENPRYEQSLEEIFAAAVTPEDMLNTIRRLRAELSESQRSNMDLMADMQKMVWNLGGITTIAAEGKPREYNADMALPALDAMNALAEKYVELQNAVRSAIVELDMLQDEMTSGSFGGAPGHVGYALRRLSQAIGVLPSEYSKWDRE